MSTLKQTTELLKFAHKAGLSAWIHGAPGIGKTESVYQYAKLAGLPVIKAFAPTMDIIDVKGI
jgi:DNA transposition AAA+ family ATPase